jgi:polyisoprenoid-binding protein YceI
MLRTLWFLRKSSHASVRLMSAITGAGFGVALALQAVSISPALAMEWSVDLAQSSIAFETTVGQRPLKGAFKRFTADIEFDPDTPGAANIRVTVDLSSARTGNAQADQALPSTDWFDVSQFPRALLQSNSVRALGGDRYELRGRLSLRDASRPVTFPFTLHVDDSGQARAQGEFTVSRSDFGVGPSTPVDGTPIDDAVQIILDVSATRLDN